MVWLAPPLLDSDHYVNLSEKSVAEGGTGVSEADDLESSRKGLGSGYGRPKWAAEYQVRQAGKRGLKGAIIRPGYVTGSPKQEVSKNISCPMPSKPL